MRSKSWSWIFIPFLLAALRAVGVAQIATTQIVDTIYHADGTTATGTALIAWPAFTTSAGDQVPAGNTSAVIASGGALSVQLIANSGAIPVGTYYTVTYHLDDNSVTRQYWVVPQSAAPVRIGAIESTVMPTSMAIQTATKSYVDTAIAAATTGHPLDSSPLVLKAGDTMTGPLVLPADPVSSLQASTKHYVDAAVAAGLATSSTLTGQTPNYIPLATSSTASTTSSHFFEQTGTSGVANPFQMQVSTPNCNLNGPTFLRWGCNNINIYDDGTTDVSHFGGSLAGTTMTMQAWGTAGINDVEGRATVLFSDSNNGAMVTPGGKFGWSSNTNFFGIGDVLANKNVHECHGGLAYASDQGCQLVYERFTDLGFWHGTVLAGGTNTQPLVNGTGGCSNPENQACAPTNGWIMVDTSKMIASGQMTGPPTAFLPVAWTSTVPTNMTMPVPSAWGTALGINITAGTAWNNPQPQTITIGAGGGTGSGTFAAGDLACVIGDKFHEQEIITAASGSAGAQTITIPLSRPEGSVLVVKGQCGYVMSTANDAHGMTYVLPATSIDGSHMIVASPGFSAINPWGGGQAGAEWWTTDGGTNSTVNYYAGARILWVGTSRPGFYPFNDTGILLTLEPNTFSVGDRLISPDYPLQKFDGEELNVDMQLPSNSAGSLTGKWIRLTGPGLSGAAAALRMTNEQDVNSYTPNGGPLTEPTQIFNSGYWDTLHFGGYTPLKFGFHFGSHQPGQTSYEVWHDPSWGALSIDNGSNWHFINSSVVLDQGSLSTAGGVFSSYGMRTGDGDGASNGAGLEFPFSARKSASSSWLTPCDLTSDNSKLDLCVTSQGAGRTNGIAAPDRGLRAGTLTAGTVTGDTMSTSGTSTASTTLALNSSSPDASCMTMAGTGAGVDQWQLCSLGTSISGTGHKVGIADDTQSNWAWTLYMASISGPGYIESPNFMVNCWSSGVDVTATLCDTGLSRAAAHTVNVGNGAAGDASGTLNAAALNSTTTSAQLYQGPATAPTGACSTVGWAFSQDGHISYCNGSSWVQKM
jgi:hypothetical protein